MYIMYIGIWELGKRKILYDEEDAEREANVARFIVIADARRRVALFITVMFYFFQNPLTPF